MFALLIIGGVMVTLGLLLQSGALVVFGIILGGGLPLVGVIIAILESVTSV